MDLTSQYIDIVVDHDRRPRHAGLRDPFTSEVRHRNPACGDEITLRLHLVDTVEGPRVQDLSYDASGCALSRASASIMSERMIGRRVGENELITRHLDVALHSRGRLPGQEDLLGDGVALLGAARFPVRVSCVLMAWKAYEAALLETRLLGLP